MFRGDVFEFDTFKNQFPLTKEVVLSWESLGPLKQSVLNNMAALYQFRGSLILVEGDFRYRCKCLLKAWRDFLHRAERDEDQSKDQERVSSYVNSMIALLRDLNFPQELTDELIADKELFFSKKEGLYSRGIFYSDGTSFKGVLPKNQDKNNGIELNVLIIVNFLNSVDVYLGPTVDINFDEEILNLSDFHDKADLIPWANLIRQAKSTRGLFELAINMIQATGPLSFYKTHLLFFPHHQLTQGVIAGNKGIMIFSGDKKGFSEIIPAGFWNRYLEEVSEENWFFLKTSHLSGNRKRDYLNQGVKDPSSMEDLRKFKGCLLKTLDKLNKEDIECLVSTIQKESSSPFKKSWVKSLSLLCHRFGPLKSGLIQEGLSLKELVIVKNYENLPVEIIPEALEYFKKLEDKAHEKQSTLKKEYQNKIHSLRKQALKKGSGKTKLKGVFGS